ncbi:unnamed protein product [Lathyrus sativus]|nr:unnamed protein product [Lathyrus sativus]
MDNNTLNVLSKITSAIKYTSLSRIEISNSRKKGYMSIELIWFIIVTL